MQSEIKSRGGMLTKPGAMLREIRLKSGLTLAELSDRTGLPPSTLSKVENDKMSLTYDKLARISEGLKLDIAQIFGSEKSSEPEVPAKGRRSITRANEGGVIDTPGYTHIYHATDLLNKKFIPIVGEIKHRSIAEFGELIRHEGEEYSYVLEGTLEFHSDLYAPVILGTGDSIYFDSSMGHAYIALGDEPCWVLSICSGDLQAIDFEARSQAGTGTGSNEPVITRSGTPRQSRSAGQPKRKVKAAQTGGARRTTRTSRKPVKGRTV